MQGYSDPLASRIREIRVEKFGMDGISSLSQAMKIGTATWEHFENGVMIPGYVILQFIELTGVEPRWLLTGEGERYRVRRVKSRRGASQ